MRSVSAYSSIVNSARASYLRRESSSGANTRVFSVLYTLLTISNLHHSDNPYRPSRLAKEPLPHPQRASFTPPKSPSHPLKNPLPNHQKPFPEPPSPLPCPQKAFPTLTPPHFLTFSPPPHSLSISPFPVFRCQIFLP